MPLPRDKIRTNCLAKIKRCSARSLGAQAKSGDCSIVTSALLEMKGLPRFCAFWCEPIDDTYFREVGTRIIYCRLGYSGAHCLQRFSCSRSGGRMRSDRKVSCGNCGNSRWRTRHYHYNLPFCCKKCKQEYLDKIAKDRGRIRHWFGDMSRASP